MRQTIVRFILFLFAYLPIYIIGALKTIKGPFRDDCGDFLPIVTILENNKIPVFLVLLAILLTLYFLVYSRFGISPKGTPLFKIKTIIPQHKEYVTYLGTYILPFVGLKAGSIFEMLAIVFMFITIGYIYSKTKLIYTNPTLILFGYDIYEVEDENGNKYDCISKEVLNPNDLVIGKKLAKNTFIIKKWKKPI